MWIERQISDELRKLAGSFPIVALIGPRQVGKTSLLERIFPEYNYVSFDEPSVAEMAETRPNDFLKESPPPLIIDEIQYAPGLFRHLKAMVDRIGKRGLFIITGSQNFLLMQSISDSLAGRVAIIPLLGLSAREWSAIPDIFKSYDWTDFLWKGSFPALWADMNDDHVRDRWYQGYIATYLERDIRNLLNVDSLRDFQRFMTACAARVAQTLNMSEIGRDVGISAPTARKWISLLQTSNQIFLLEPYYRSLGKRIVKSPKLYFTDSGLAAYLLGIQSAEALWEGISAGAFWENHVITQWLRRRDWFEPSTNLWYWRDKNGHEIDLVIERNNRLFPIECKRSEHPDSTALRGIRKLRKFYGKEMVGQGFIASTTPAPYDLDEETTVVNGWKVGEEFRNLLI